tara:strand:+ start:2886 stop:3746 length:861 start_codon:yes stop_codon:yes gene_type:complete
MKNEKCYLCGNIEFENVEGKLRDLPDIKILRCKNCGLVFLESFDHINDNFYEDSKMIPDKTKHEWETHLKDCEDDDIRRSRFISKMCSGKSILDFGCGGGGFLLKIKDSCSKCDGLEKDRAFVKIMTEQGFKIYNDIDELTEKYDIITLFHVLEHLKDPKDMLNKLSKHLNSGGQIIIEVPQSNDALLSMYKCKAFTEFTYWGCHLFLFNNFTLNKVIQDAGLNVDYIKNIQRYPLSNHLYWISHGKPGGHVKWDFLDSPETTKAYEAQLAKKEMCDTLIACVSVK